MRILLQPDPLPKKFPIFIFAVADIDDGRAAFCGGQALEKIQEGYARRLIKAVGRFIEQ